MTGALSSAWFGSSRSLRLATKGSFSPFSVDCGTFYVPEAQHLSFFQIYAKLVMVAQSCLAVGFLLQRGWFQPVLAPKPRCRVL
jgi:hypothetical protein